MQNERMDIIRRDEEIDLVDVIAVLIKRKNIIIWLVLATLIFSGLYTISSIKKINYTIKLNIVPSRELTIDVNNALTLENAQLDTFISNVRKSLYEHSSDIPDGKRKTNYTFQIEESEDIVTRSSTVVITLTGNKEKVIEGIKILYSIYGNFENEINLRNEKTLRIAETALEADLNEKTEMLERLKRFINEGKLFTLPQGSETTIMNTLNSLTAEIIKIKRNLELTKTIELRGGNFYIVKENKWKHMEPVNQNTLDNLETHLRPEKSKKRMMLPVVVSVFLAFFIGVFMAFVVEFFSREDVKKRIREAAKKNT